MSRGRSVITRCTPTKKCDFHRDGGPRSAKCPGTCDAKGCTLEGYYEVGEARVTCAAHGALVLLARAVHEALGADDADDLTEGR